MVKKEKKITKQLNKTVSQVASSINTQLSNNNKLKVLTKVSLLSLITNAIADTLDIESIAKSKAVKFDKDQNNLIVVFFASKVEKR